MEKEFTKSKEETRKNLARKGFKVSARMNSILQMK